MKGIVFNRPIYIIEGFDMVGKSTFIEKYMNKYNLYYPNHDLTDETISRDNSWVIGYSVLDYLRQLPEQSIPNTVISRGVFSGEVYKKLYSRKSLDSKIIEWFKNDDFFNKFVGHIYLKHKDVDSAKIIYEKSKSRPESNNKITKYLDNFRSFNDYWIYYTNADLIFNDLYDRFGITPRVFEIDAENNDFIEVIKEG